MGRCTLILSIILYVLLGLHCPGIQAFVPQTPSFSSMRMIREESQRTPQPQHRYRTRTRQQESIGTPDALKDILAKYSRDAVYEKAIVLLTPAAMFLLAFSTYPETSQAFHEFVDLASGHTWATVDGGAYLTDLIAPALTGPVASFISLLFGTLTSMTVGNLYVRQNTMARLLGDCLEDLRLMDLHVKALPTNDYKVEGQDLIRAYSKLILLNLGSDEPYEATRDRREASRRILEKTMELLHRVSGDTSVSNLINGRALDEAYATLNRLISTRSQLVSTYENSFPIWHYGNLAILAVAILFIFLVLTDKTALLYLGGFQLRICWAMLIGTLTMLTVVIYDLMSPLSGAFQIVRPVELRGFSLEEFVASTIEEEENDGTGPIF